VGWLAFNWYHGRNSMLADEMGLGKTVQAVTTLEHIHRVVRRVITCVGWWWCG
jgi:chromodomain-helicase-DNA-binding protein 7